MSHAAKRREVEREPVRVLGRGLRVQRGLHLTLRGVREAVGRTQVELSEATGMDQGDVSRLEKRELFDDCQVGTLQRFVSALGGRLELVAAFGDKRIVLTGAKATTAAAPANKALQRKGRRAPRR
jgi:hypothetical protein